MMHGLQGDVIKAALTTMINRGYFDICTVDSILKMTGGIPPKREYDLLRNLHCVHYSTMSPRLRLELPRILQIVLESAPMTFEISAPNNLQLLPPK